MVYIVISYFLVLTYYASAQQGCVSPPMECPNENVTFWLYTRENQDNPHQLLAMEPGSIESAPWVPDAPVKVLIHGYTGHKDFSPNTEIRPAYLKCCDYNIISVDYNPIAREPCYLQAARNTELVGQCAAQLVDRLVQRHGFALPLFHVIGFSLGGQTAGYMGNYITSGQLERISGLDPAMPMFVSQDKKRKLDAGDARQVDVLHTNALEKGKLEASGTSDFYANGGLTQPGCTASAYQMKEKHREETYTFKELLSVYEDNCTKDPKEVEVYSKGSISKSGCDHARAPAYYAESITTDVGFYATRCFSWITYMIGWCEPVSSDEEVLYGEYMPQNASGPYFFATNSESPYARGRNKKPSRSIFFF